MAASSRAEYLKKYLSENSEEKKKKKRRKVVGGVPVKAIKLKIIDDDVDLHSLLPDDHSNTLDDYVGDNDPTIAEVVDERPEHVIRLEKYRASEAWKLIGHREKKQQQEGSDSDDTSPKRRRHDSDSDQSLPRRKRHDSNSSQSPPRRQRHDSDSDQSPPRRKRHDSNSTQSPPRRQRHDSDSDQSPPMRIAQNSDSDQSPPRRQSGKSVNTDKSNRKSNGRFSDIKDNSQLRRKRHDSDSDQSPPRRQRKASDSDQSPPRRQRKASDSDQSPPRRRRKASDSDQSPPRKRTSKKKEEKTLSGKRAGLSSAQEMRREADELKRKEDEKFKQISDDRLGKGAATVFRDKSSGRRRNLAEEKKLDDEESRKKAKDDEKFQAWGKGLKQIEQQSQVVAEALHESNKPLARHKDDEDLDQMMRDMDRAEDPMLAFIKKKKKATGPPVKEKPRYKGPQPPPNRFGIPPGYRWDGVNRTNGFEKQIFTKQANTAATSTAAYKWSVEDM